ncbi:unnamed protein product [Hymenolepis diminuta]|uniref:mitogen-activated protein kinase kinase n=1 Tax=Hymenolepis diminuta TaxID=6216 RepID=A0A0R3SCK7_HYMDI|nr:unnamed protein product [Hymenolepis diminuta]
MSTVRRPLPLNLGETRRVPGIILPVEIGPSTQLSNQTDVIINGHKVTIEARDMEVKEELGRGEYARVHRMYHAPSKSQFAVKRLPFEVETSDRSRILNDWNVSMRTSTCPYAVLSYGALSVGCEFWVVMELMDDSLDKFLQKVYEQGKTIPENLLAYIAFCVVTALEYLRKDLVTMHRDVKPSNILIDRAGHVKVCDYGVSGELKNSMAQSNTGTCRYMAPERIDPSRSAGGGFRIQADVWSLGLTLLELATGKHPYESFVNQFELLKHVSVSFGILMFRMTECEFLSDCR